MWEKKYGKRFGYYEGPKPILVTSEPEFIKEVFVRQFSKFHARKVGATQQGQRGRRKRERER